MGSGHRNNNAFERARHRCEGGTCHMSSYVVICLHISPFVPIWLRERDLLPFCRWQNVRLRRHGSRRPTVRRTVGTDLSNPSSPPHERKTPPFGGVFFKFLGRMTGLHIPTLRVGALPLVRLELHFIRSRQLSCRTSGSHPIRPENSKMPRPGHF